MKMLRVLFVLKRNRIGNECITGTAQLEQFGDKVRKIRLRWFEPVQRRDRGYYGERMLKMELPGTREGKD